MNFDISKLKHLPRLISAQESKIFNSLTAIFILALVIFIWTGFLKLTNVAPQAGGSYTEAVVGRPRLINPLYADNNPADRDLVKLMYAGLVKFNGADIVPDLAKGWEISTDQKIYTFYLKPDISWPDGEAFTSQDVVFTFETIQNPRYQSALLSSTAGIKTAALDELTVRFTLPKPLTPFLESLAVGILPAHIWSQVPPEAISLTDFNIQPLGLGPYQFERLVKDKFGAIRSYTMRRNEHYHLGVPFIKTLTLKYYDSFEQAIEGVRRNEAEGLNFLPPNLTTQIKLNKLKTHALQLPQYTAVFFNTSASSNVTDKNIRQALALAIDKNPILTQAINGQGQIIHGPVLPGYPGFHETIEKFPYNPELAGQLLTAAGWEQAADGRYNSADEKLRLTLTTANTPELTTTANIIKEAWQSIGLEVDLSIIDTAAIQASIISPRKFDILLYGEIVGVDPDPYPFWHSSQISAQGLNLSNFRHTEADQVLEEARETPDLKKKSEKYVHFQNILVADIPAVFLYNPDYLYPVSEKVKGLKQLRIINPADRFANIHQWFIKTKRVFN